MFLCWILVRFWCLRVELYLSLIVRLLNILLKNKKSHCLIGIIDWIHKNKGKWLVILSLHLKVRKIAGWSIHRWHLPKSYLSNSQIICTRRAELSNSNLKLWHCIGGRVKQKFGVIKHVDKGWITTVNDLECWRFKP